jgi:hypothetical protein
MSLAVYLTLELATDPEIRWDDDMCFYFFPDTYDLRELVSKFYGNQAAVNPREYNREFSRLKRATFRHPDSPKPRFRNKIPA